MAAQFLQITNDFKVSSFWEISGPAGKPNNRDKEYLDVKVLFRAMLAIHREEINLAEFFWFFKPNNMDPNQDMYLLKEHDKRLKQVAKY